VSCGLLLGATLFTQPRRRGILRSPNPTSCIDRLLEGARERSKVLWVGAPESTWCGVDKDARAGHSGGR
jgi:hypothetical protein